MDNNRTAMETISAFIQGWFEQCDVACAVSFLCENVNFAGPGANETAYNKSEMEAYISQDIKEISQPFLCEFKKISEQTVGEHVHNLAMEIMLSNKLYKLLLKAFFTLVREEDGPWKILSFHFIKTDGGKKGNKYYRQALIMENIARQSQEVLDDFASGGMIGEYLEKGFPFYFINRQMLHYLGYKEEAEFAAAVEKQVSNCIHPDDRDMVEESVGEQLRNGEEYKVEYRMQKKDGSYIWIRDAGRKITAEDGRPAIVSVCTDITLQKKLSHELLHLYNNIPGAVFRCRFDKDFSIIEANDGLFDFLGYTREEFMAMGNKMSAVIHPDDYEIMADKIKAQLKHGNTIHNENRLICKNGIPRWIAIKAQLLQEEDGAQFFCVFLDITEEKKLRDRNRELYERELEYFAELSSTEGGSMQGTFNLTQNCLESCLVTTDAKVSNIAESYSQTIQYMADSAVDPMIGEQIRSELEREKLLTDYAAGKVDYEFVFLRRRNGGGYFWGSTKLRTFLNPGSGDIVVFFYINDVTEQKLKERMLHQIAHLDYEMLTEVDIFHDTYRVLSFEAESDNTIAQKGRFQEAARILAEEYMEEPARKEYLEKVDFNYIKQQLEKVNVYSFIVEEKDKQGNKRVKRLEIFYVEKVLGQICIARSDVTDVVQREQKQRDELAAALVAAEQANAAKSDFLSRMSHEIRTPMNAIIGMSAIAAQSIGDDEQVADCISKIGISSRFLLSLINDILDMSRIESGKMLLKNEKIPTEEFLYGINAICFSQAEARGVDYECIVDPVLHDYYIGDAMKLQQVLLNILSNAIKFTGEGGKVTFSVEQRKRIKNDALLRFVINDTGVGMGEDFMPHIFEPFSQESTGTTALYGGTGLGLAISKNIVDLMGGKITVRSIKGIGTEFTVDIKLGITEEEKLHHRQKKPQYNFSHLKTLVVDDDVTVCESAVVTLHEMGVSAEWVDSGRKAIERVQELNASGKFFDMILIDWKMPEMDGIETARRIRNIVGPDVTIIIVTAYDWASIEHEARLAGVNLLISKPMFKSSLVSAFSRALGEKEEEEKLAETADYDFTGRRVLLAEDNALNTEVAVMLLESKGFTVETAENGLRALEMFSKSSREYYDAIIMDIRMPLMDGLTAATSIRHLSNADAAAIPIIAMTANAFDNDIEKSKAAGMDAHLAKPIDPERLFQTLYDLIVRKEV